MGIVSRRRKRFLLNEAELVDAALALGVEVQLLPFEAMTLYEQLAALRSTTILVGVLLLVWWLRGRQGRT